MKVLVVVKTLELGGVGSVIFSFFEALVNSDIDMDFAAGMPVDDRYREIIEKHHKKLYITNKDANPAKYVADLAKIVKNGGYQVVHVHGNSALITPDLLGAYFGNAKVRIAHSHNTQCGNQMLNQLMKPVFQKLYTHALACGRDAGKWMFGAKPYTVIKNGISLQDNQFSQVRRKAIREKLNIKDNEFLVGHVGNFNYQKNHQFLVEIFKELLNSSENAKLLLVGDGETREEIKRQIRDCGIEEHVILYGVSKHVDELLDAMDCFVLPSRFEGLPCVLVEAQAHGLPCVVSDAVTPEACMSEAYAVCSVDGSPNEWIKQIENMRCVSADRVAVCRENQEQLKKCGYDLADAAQTMLEIYHLGA